MGSVENIKVLICGGGNGAHVFAGFSSIHFDTRVLDLYSDEAQRWSDAMASSPYTIHVDSPDGSTKQVTAKPFRVSKNPNDVVPGSDIVIIAVPAFAHGQYLEQIKPHLTDGVYIVGFPGQAGFEFGCKGILGGIKFNLINFETLPWACRIKKYGADVEVLGTKDVISGVSFSPHVSQSSHIKDATLVMQTIMGEHPKLNVSDSCHPIAMTLMALNAYVHTSIMYARWKDWDGKPLDQAPLFYHGLDEYGAHVMSSMSDEVLNIAKKIKELKPEIDLSDVEHIWDWYLKCYGHQMDDKSTLLTSIRTNHAYTGLTHPVKKTDGGYVPDYGHRYLAEDVPMGLLVLRGVAQIVQVHTPYMDTVLEWSQKQMDKEYLVNGKLNGRDMQKTRTPQKYGFHTVDDILLL